MKKLLSIFIFISAFCIGASAASDSWVKLDATNFPDANFRAFLKRWSATGLSGTTTVYNENLYNSTTNEINRDGFNELNFNYADGKVYGVQVYYTKIASLEGIKLLRNVTSITLPAISKTSTYQLKSLDVSGMPMLETITNGATNSRGFPYTVNNTGTSSKPSSPATKFNLPLATINADNCPRLREIRVSNYKNLKTLTFAGSDNIVNLYVLGSGIEKLDISNLSKMFNEKTGQAGVYGDQAFADAIGMGTNDAMDTYITFSLNGCASLKELNLGDVNIHFLDVSGCPLLETLDVSGQKNLFRLYANMGYNTTTTWQFPEQDKLCNTNHSSGKEPTGALKNVIFGQKDIIYLIHINGGQFKEMDPTPFAETVVDLDLSYNRLQSFDIAACKKATSIDLGYNRIGRLDLPANKSITTLAIAGNSMTFYPQFDGNYSRLNSFVKPFQVVRIGDAWKWRVFDDPSQAQYVMTDDDTASQKYYYGITNCRIGDPEKDEYDAQGNPTGKKQDPCYVYFFNTDADAESGRPTSEPFAEAFYYYHNEYVAKTPHSMYNWMKVYFCRSTPNEWDPAPEPDPEVHEFYLAGDFNDWTPTEAHKFKVTDAKSGLYHLPYENWVVGNFRVWNAPQVEAATLNFGGHESDLNGAPADSHVHFTHNYYYKLGEDETRHYTSFKHDDQGIGLYKPEFELKYLPEGGESNYLLVRNDATTGIENIVDDSDNAEVETYTVSGVRVDATGNLAPGVYIRKQGSKVSKILVK